MVGKNRWRFPEIKLFPEEFSLNRPLTEEMQEIMAVEQAKKEWQDTRKQFEEATVPELIDQAIYQMQAAELKYMYLLKRVRAKREKKRSEASE
ncbi:MAG: DUF2508 family protein [Bacillota bacterium]|jgi:hypothetical protein